MSINRAQHTVATAKRGRERERGEGRRESVCEGESPIYSGATIGAGAGAGSMMDFFGQLPK